MERLGGVFGGIALVGILVGCSGPNPSPTETATPSFISSVSIVGTWRPASMAGVVTGLPAATGDHDVKFFARSWVAANGCNHDSAFYKVGPGGRFSTTDPANDLMVCISADPTPRQQSRSKPGLPTADVLKHASFVRVDTDSLTFTDATGHLLARFTRVA